jgi:hypothetical protein
VYPVVQAVVTMLALLVDLCNALTEWSIAPCPAPDEADGQQALLQGRQCGIPGSLHIWSRGFNMIVHGESWCLFMGTVASTNVTCKILRGWTRSLSEGGHAGRLDLL